MIYIFINESIDMFLLWTITIINFIGILLDAAIVIFVILTLIVHDDVIGLFFDNYYKLAFQFNKWNSFPDFKKMSKRNLTQSKRLRRDITKYIVIRRQISNKFEYTFDKSPPNNIIHKVVKELSEQVKDIRYKFINHNTHDNIINVENIHKLQRRPYSIIFYEKID